MCSPLKMSATFLLCFSITWWGYCSASSASGVNSSSEGRLNQGVDIRASDYHRLEAMLLKDYNHHLRPVHSHRTVTHVSLTIGVVAIQEVNEAYQTLSHSSWFEMRWTDQFLKWDPADFDGLNVIELSEDLIWTPNLYVANSLSDTKDGVGSFARVSNDGKIIWAPIGMKETLCSLDITFYPFDTQKCDMIIKMWTAPESEVHMNVSSAVVDSSTFAENSEWILTDLTVKPRLHAYMGKRYSQFVVFFHLKRRRLFHTLTLVVPNVLLALLAGFVFLLPQECGEKMSFSMSLLLAFAVNLSVLVSAMPRSSLQVSLLMIYLTSLSVTTALSVVTTVCLLKLYHKVGIMGSQPNDVSLDTDDAQNPCDDHKVHHECQISRIPSEKGTQENDTLSSEWSSPNVNVSNVNNGELQTNPQMLRETLRSGKPQRKALSTWKDLAITLDYICFRVFVVVIVGMTSALVVALFVGQ
ncbi:neuronal acetylcholine receptor subunit alpha-6-like [Littorina saxatilis]|uniref:neuronal acetylcholine receptor subunit alpha-6-like n=1 Tax=Littorina saxatilis TaxID=31220 RepID=UPI0038B4C085